MANNAAKTELATAHAALAGVLDVKLKDMPEWQAFRAIDRALIALDAPNDSAPASPQTRNLTISDGVVRRSFTSGKVIFQKPYTLLAGNALNDTGRPVTTPEIIEYIRKHRSLGDDLEKAKVNITSALSKDERFTSVPWEGGRAWWFADKPVPAGKKMSQLLE